MQRRTLLLLPLVVLAVAAVAWLLLAGGTPRSPEPPRDEGAPAPTSHVPPDLLRSGDGATAGGGTDAAGHAAAAHPRLPAALTGEVVDEDGRGIPRAAVVLRRVDPRSLRGAPYPDGPVLASTQSERDGSFRLEAPAETWLRLSASAPGRASAARLVASAGAHVVLVLPPAGTLAIQVLDATARPVAGALVTAATGETVRRGEADASGRLTLADALPGTWRLAAEADGRGRAAAGPFQVRAGARTPALVVLARAVAVSGTVLDDASGEPLAGARVHVARPGHAAAATTDAHGRFGPVEAGGLGERVFVAVSAEGHAPALEPVILRGDGPLDTVVRLARAEPWTGRVLDARGAPVEGARVWTTDDGISGPTPPVETGADGAFRVPPPHPPAPGRRVLLVAEKGGARAALALRPGMLPPRPLVLTLAGGTRVSGRVQDRRGADLAGVIVRLVPSWGDVPRGFHPDADTSRLLLANERGFPGLSTATGAGGAWSVGDVPPGPWVLVFEHDGVRQRRPEVLQVGTRPLAAGTEVLDEGRSIVGDVVDARGDPVPGAAVDVRADGEGRALRRARSGTDGHFAVEGLAPGRYLVTAVVSGRPPARAVADLEREDVVSVGLALEEPAALRVRVTRAGAPWDGVLTLAFADARGGRGTARRVTERVQHGVLALDDAPTGLWTVQGFAAGGLRAQARQVALDAGRETGCELDLAPAARLAGVVRSADGSPAAAARVTLVDAAGDVRLPATSAADGSFSFEDLAPGSWTLEAYGRGGAPARRDVQVASGPAQAVELRLAPAGTLHVRVRDEAGRPVAEARLAFLAADGLVRTLTPARTGRDGMASQGDLPEGGLRVRAQAPDGRSGEAEAEVQAGRTVEVDVRLGAAER